VVFGQCGFVVDAQALHWKSVVVFERLVVSMSTFEGTNALRVASG